MKVFIREALAAMKDGPRLYFAPVAAALRAARSLARHGK
jgi:hypothetical protein